MQGIFMCKHTLLTERNASWENTFPLHEINIEFFEVKS